MFYVCSESSCLPFPFLSCSRRTATCCVKYFEGSATNQADSIAMTPKGMVAKNAMRKAYVHASREAFRPAAAISGVTPLTVSGFPAAKAFENAAILFLGNPKGRTALAIYAAIFSVDFSFIMMFRVVLPRAPPRKRKVPIEPCAMPKSLSGMWRLQQGVRSIGFLVP